MSCNKSLVILAGGLGSRYNGLKQIDGITDNGAPILEYSIYDAKQAGFNKVILILNKKIPQSYLDRIKTIGKENDIDVNWVYQEINLHIPDYFDINERQKPWGTAHAMLCVKDLVNEPFLIINADDFYGKEVYLTAAEIINNNEISDDQYHIIPYLLDTTISANGSVSRGVCDINPEGYLEKIVEFTKINHSEKHIYYLDQGQEVSLDPKTLVSMNFSIFDPSIFKYLETEFRDFLNNKPDLKSEFFIPAVIQNLIKNKLIKVKTTVSPSQWMGITYPDDKDQLKDFLLNEISKNRYPENLWIKSIF